MSTVKQHFGAIASQYDRNNAILSLGLFRLWNRKLVQAVPQGGVLLDLCAGTGEIAFAHLRRAKKSQHVILLDFCQEMLDVAKKRAPQGHHLTYICADACAIPLQDNAVEAVTTAYGIRNVPDPLACAREVHRVLKPGGRWAILELTRPKSPVLKALHGLYLKTWVPAMGGLFSPSKEAYRYLSSSISQFTAPSS
jgi:demethylmenaquinone methyltransferase / 2-methoxy-6-polyprenyl-1,4-benzoquinol methylase